MSNKLAPLEIESEFNRAYDEFVKDRNIEKNSWENYSGFDYGQWPTDAKNELRRSNRHIIQLNYIRGKINTLAGSIIRNGQEVDFVPVDDSTVDATKLLKGLFYSDREMLDWDSEFVEVVKDGLIHRGIMQMYISEKYSPLGNIALKRVQPGHLILDPNWVSHTDKDLTRVWRIAYLTPREMKEIYGKKASKIDDYVKIKAEQISSYEKDTATESMQNFNLEAVYGDKYRVIEYHHIRIKEVEKIVYIGEGGEVELTGMKSEDVDAYVMQAEVSNPGKLIRKKYKKKEYWISTSCNQLFSGAELLEDAKSEIQIGRLPFYIWSAARINGRDSGMVSLLEDAQRAINKRESLSDHIIASSAKGAMAIDPALFNNDIVKTENAIKELDKPNARFITAPGALASGRQYFYQIPKAQYAGEIYQEIDRMRNHMDSLSGATATLEGRSESSHDTGILFARRQMQSEIALTTLSEGLRQFWNDIGESYMLLAEKLYTGAYRRFKTDFGVKGDDATMIELNNGSFSLKDLPRAKVLISQSQRGTTVREVERSVNAELLNRIPPNQYVYMATITNNIMKTLDMTGEEKKMLDSASELEMQLALKRAQLELANMDAQLGQIQMQQQQAQMMAMQGGGGENPPGPEGGPGMGPDNQPGPGMQQ